MAEKGHSSKNGVVTAMSASTGKCLDYRVISKSYKGSHGSSFFQKTIFKRSLDENNFRYVSYIGDGDI